MQWRSYTQAYLGLCPRKIHWCTGKNNVESKGQRPVIKHVESLSCEREASIQTERMVFVAKNSLRSNLKVYNFKIFLWWEHPPARLADECYACTA